MISKEIVQKIIADNYKVYAEKGAEESEPSPDQSKWSNEKLALKAWMEESLSNEELFDLVALMVYGRERYDMRDRTPYPAAYTKKRKEIEENFSKNKKCEIVNYLLGKGERLSDYLERALPLYPNEDGFAF